MTPCYYIITNIKGGSELTRIPAFNLLTSEDLKPLLSNYSEKSSTIELTAEDKEKLNTYLKQFIHHQSVKRILGESVLINTSELIDQVNAEIVKQASPDDLWRAIKLNVLDKKTRIKAEEGKEALTVDSMIRKLSMSDNKVESRLFITLSPEPSAKVHKLLSESSLNDELEDLGKEIQNFQESNYPTLYLSRLKSFLKLASEALNWNSGENIIKIENDRLKEGSWNTSTRLIYSDTPNKEYLFLGLFKRLGSKLSQEQFEDIFSKWNTVLAADKYAKYRIDFTTETPESFFFGTSTNKKVVLPKFDEILILINDPILKVKNLVNETFDKLFTNISYLIADVKGTSQSTAKDYYYQVKNLFVTLYPDFSDSTKIKEVLAQEEKIIEDTKQASNAILREILTTVQSLIKTPSGPKRNSLGLLYQPSIKINTSAEDTQGVQTETTYNYLMSNLVLGKDLIRMPWNNSTSKDKTKWPYWIVKSIYVRKNKKIAIAGIRLDNEGKAEVSRYEFDPSEQIEYRKYTPYAETEYQEDAKVNENAISLLMPQGLTFELAKNLLSVGDYLGNRKILGIYPGFIHVYDQAKDAEDFQGYSQTLTQVEEAKTHLAVSKKLFNLLNDAEYKNFSMGKSIGATIATKDSESFELLAEGDYFQLEGWNSFKKIVYADNNYVWTFVKNESKTYKTKNNYLLVPYKKSDIISGIVSTFKDSKDAFELMNLINTDNFLSKNSKSTLSIFANPEIVKLGDFIIDDTTDEILVGKVINLEKKFGLFWNTTTKTWNKRSYANKAVRFLSKDARINENAIFSLKANFREVELLFHDQVSPTKYKKMAYAVNKSIDPEVIKDKTSRFIPGSFYTEIGEYKEVSYLEESDLDLTESIILSLGGDPKTQGLYTPFTGVNKYKRAYQSASLKKILGIENLSSEFIENTMLFPGAYFSIYTNQNNKNSIRSTIYRIEKIVGNTLYAREYFRNINGDILLNEVAFNVNELVNTTKSGELHAANSIADYYIQHGSEKFAVIIEEINKNTKATSQDDKDFKISRLKLKKKLSEFFTKINVEVEEVEDLKEFIPGQKAKFVTLDNGYSKVILKKDLGTRDDLVHEVMHIFLAALRHTAPETYMNVLNSVESVANFDGSLLEKEELFLTNINPILRELDDSFFTTSIDTKSLLDGLKIAGLNINNEILPDSLNKNIVEILKQPIVSFLKLRSKDNTHPLFNSNLAQVTPAFMRWLEKEHINLKCN